MLPARAHRTKMPRGGKRKGAGAPRGNVNALVNALRSKQIPQAIQNALEDPDGRARVLHLLRAYHAPTRPVPKPRQHPRCGGNVDNYPPKSGQIVDNLWKTNDKNSTKTALH
ncbi:hypothetical protein ES703_70385 [subsurface metagenome]